MRPLPINLIPSIVTLSAEIITSALNEASGNLSASLGLTPAFGPANVTPLVISTPPHAPAHTTIVSPVLAASKAASIES